MSGQAAHTHAVYNIDGKNICKKMDSKLDKLTIEWTATMDQKIKACKEDMHFEHNYDEIKLEIEKIGKTLTTKAQTIQKVNDQPTAHTCRHNPTVDNNEVTVISHRNRNPYCPLQTYAR